MKFKSLEDLGQIRDQFDEGEKDQVKTGSDHESKKQDFEKIKSQFLAWTDQFIAGLYEDNLPEIDLDTMDDAVMNKISNLTGNDGYKITKEKEKLTLIFIDRLTFFCQELIFSKDFNKDDINKFYSKLQKTLFCSSRDVLENLNNNFLQKLISCSEINEIYKLGSIVNPSLDLAYDLSSCSNELIKSLSKNIKTLSGSKKISAIKQLAGSAMTAYGNGSWAYPAFVGIINLIKEVSDDEESPIISFVLDFELKKVLNFSHNSDLFEDADSIEEYEEEDIYIEPKNVSYTVSNESSEFFGNYDITPKLDNTLYSRVSKDYGSVILPYSLIPIAIVKMPERENVEGRSNHNFTSEEIKSLSLFLGSLDNTKEKNDEYYMDVVSMLPYLKSKGIENLDTLVVDRGDALLEHIYEGFNELDRILNKIKDNEKNTEIKVGNENIEKSKEIFDFIDNNFEKIFVGGLKNLGNRWSDYKNDNYSDGLMSIVDAISGRLEILGKDIENNSAQKVLLMSKELNQFNIDSWGSLEIRVHEVNKNLWSECSEKVLDIINMAKDINVSELKILINNIIKKNESERVTLPIENYEKITLDKELNPLGNDDFSHLIKILHSPEIRDYINNRLKINTEDLYLREQIHFLKFLSTSDESKFNKLEKILKNKEQMNNMNFLRSFLSMSGDEKMGDKILELGEKLPEEISKKVFEKYGEIIDTADNVKKILEDILLENVARESQNEINEIRESLLIRAKNILSSFYDKKGEDNNDLIKDLERYKTEVLLYADTYKKLNEYGKEVKLEDIKNTEITILSQDEKEKMAENFWNINKANRPFIKEGSEEMQNREKSFNLTIKNKNSDFYVLKYKDTIISFCSFTPDINGDLYFESLNTESEARGSHIGSEFLPAVLEKVKKLGKNIYGHVHARNSGTLSYYKRLGFEINEVKEGAELKYYEIRIPSEQIRAMAA